MVGTPKQLSSRVILNHSIKIIGSSFCRGATALAKVPLLRSFPGLSIHPVHLDGAETHNAGGRFMQTSWSKTQSLHLRGKCF